MAGSQSIRRLQSSTVRLRNFDPEPIGWEVSLKVMPLAMRCMGLGEEQRNEGKRVVGVYNCPSKRCLQSGWEGMQVVRREWFKSSPRF